MRKSDKIISLVSLIVFLFLVIGLVGFVLKFTNGGTDSFKFFYVSNTSGKIYATTDNVKLISKVTTKFNVSYTFSTENSGYTVKVVPTITDKTKFEYTVQGEEKPRIWSKDLDITPALSLNIYDNYFTVTLPENMKDFLELIHKKPVMVAETVDIMKLSYFNLVVISNSELSKITLNLFKAPTPVEEIKLSQDKIIFGFTEPDNSAEAPKDPTLNEDQIIFGDKSLSVTVVANNEYLTDINTSSTLALSNENIRVEFYYNDDSIYENFATVKITLKNKDTGKIISVYGLGSGVYCKDNEYMDFYFDFTMPYCNVEVVIDIVNIR